MWHVLLPFRYGLLSSNSGRTNGLLLSVLYSEFMMTNTGGRLKL